ncbi:hypothetical protein JKG47_22235 [Acidithiobacillus sp. MC6.1]|nr:hypothetical protein [Acidithiobacillus sp. MC6.1]
MTVFLLCGLNSAPTLKWVDGTVRVERPVEGTGEPFGSPHGPAHRGCCHVHGRKNSRKAAVRLLSGLSNPITGTPVTE